MHHRKIAFWLIGLGAVCLAAIGVFLLMPARPVSAQCGSQASSCKNCHETQAQDPVSNDTTTWHGQHAFGDFCYLCHGGNNQSMDKTTAHTGMIDPMTDIVVSCKSCHPDDFETRAQVYANTLGIKLSSLKSTIAATQNAPAAASAGATSASNTAAPAAAAPAASVIPAADMVDYSQRYGATALGQKPVNIGNIIIIVLIAAIVLVGGFFVARREGWLKVSFQDTKTIQGSYPADVVDMAPALASLKPSARRDLQQILSKPGMAAELFALVTKLTKGEEPVVQEEQPAELPEEENPNQ
jgi:hypothetical protein